MRLTDSHCHLQSPRLLHQAPELIRAARQLGVERFFTCGTGPSDWPALRSLAHAHAEIIPFFGVHPWYLDQAGPEWESALQAMLDHLPSGIGEIGLDHAVEPRDDARQETFFLAQLALARERKLPLNLHCRKAFDRLASLLEAQPLTAPALVHSYSGPAELIPRLSAAGVYFSFSGSVTRSGNKRVHRALAVVPLDRLLIETDAPDIPPVIDHAIDYEHPNEPAHLVHVLHAVAAVKGVSAATIAEITWKNAELIIRSLHL